MHLDIEHGVQAAALHTTNQEDCSMAEGHAVQSVQLITERPGRIFQGSPPGQRQGVWRMRPSPTLWSLTLMVGDGLLLLGSLASLLVLAPYFHLRFHIIWKEPGTWNLKLIWGCVALLSWSIAARVTQAQDIKGASNRFRSPLRALIALVLMVIFGMVLISPFIADRIVPSIMLLLLFLMVAVPVLSIWRVALAELMRLPPFRMQAVIIGITVAAETFAREFRKLERPGISLLGYISESADEMIAKEGLSVLGGRNILRDLIHNGTIDMVIIATDHKANPELFQEALEGAQRGIAVVPVTAVYESTSGKIPVEHIGDQWYSSLPVEQFATPLYVCWHKVMDLAFGFCGLIVLSFIFPILAPLIYLDSPGPIFYSQKRVGHRGKLFRMYKFRSMRTDAEHSGGAKWATEKDPRVTRIGRFMRATHLDELPQAFNVLRGEMSLIGPRPEREEHMVKLEKTIPFYRCRLAIKPGLTGWAQVKYHYASSENDTLIKLQYDLYYIKHQSFMIDIFIILKTFMEVFLHHGT